MADNMPNGEIAALAATQTDMASGFLSPPVSARPWVYYIVENGNQTKEGITADLEAMARVGIGGLLFMEVEQGKVNGPVEFGGKTWHELFAHLCREANRLGIEINMNNDAGWTGSGGPWIPPELSMQKVVWSETRIEGGQTFSGVLPEPESNRGFYRNIAVLAFPTPAGDGVTMQGAGARLSCSGKDCGEGRFVLPLPEKDRPQWIQLEFPEPFLASTFQFQIQGAQMVWGDLLISDTGRNFRRIRNFNTRPKLFEQGFEPVMARFFRLSFTSVTQAPKSMELSLSDVELRSGFRIPEIKGKAFYEVKNVGRPLVEWPAVPPGIAIDRKQLEDLTKHMTAEGRLSWRPPSEGAWTILRFGYTTTGMENHPSPSPGRGLECDKLSKAAIGVHFKNLVGRLAAENRSLTGPGKTLVSTHIDSWEVGSQNWTPRMREEFLRRNGYDMLNYLPVMTGRVIESREASERFLWDLRCTVSDLIVENYAGEMQRLAHEEGLRFSCEAYGGGPVDDMAYAGRCDEPMGEFWSWGWGKAKYEPLGVASMVSAAHVYGKRIVGAEAFTATNVEKWQGHPARVKHLGDWAFCEGINRFVFHRYAAQPWTTVAPGMAFGPWGLHYERTQTWWEQSSAYHAYLARCQYLLRQGRFVADLLYLQPEGPGGFGVPAEAQAAPQIRGGYNCDGCPAEVVMDRLFVKNGSLVLPDGMSYRMLVLPPIQTMTPKLLRKIKDLSEAGAMIFSAGQPPRKSPSLADMGQGDDEVKRIADELWPKLITGKTAGAALAERNVPPDFQSDPVLCYTHRKTDFADIYFVANQNSNEVAAVANFRVNGKQPELWHPETGEMRALPEFSVTNGCTRVPLQFGPHESYFLVFKEKAQGKTTGDRLQTTDSGSQAHPSKGEWKAEQKVGTDRGSTELAEVRAVRGVTESGGSSGPALPKNFPALKPMMEISGSWQVQFDPRWGGPSNAVTFETLSDWTISSIEGVKYYSGTATYRKAFELEEIPGARCYLDLGKVAVMAEVKLNGKDLGIAWTPPYRLDATDALIAGQNTLEIRIVNLWINRMIGDENLSEDSVRGGGTIKGPDWPVWVKEGKPSPTGRYTFTTWRLWGKGATLVESGLLGPVRIVEETF